jgi:hypothetical protein
LLLLAVWCAWVYISWITSRFDPDRMDVRLLRVRVMLASLVMSATLPEAFDERGLGFASAYAMIQVGRTVVVRLAGPRPPAHPERPAGARPDGAHRRALGGWGACHDAARAGPVGGGAAAGLTAPLHGLSVRGLGRSRTRGVDDRGRTPRRAVPALRDRRQGESILLTGATLVDLDSSAGTLTAFVVAFAGSVALWWIYFDRGARLASDVIATFDDPGRLGRSAYAYFHVPMVAGIIVTAADELPVATPAATLPPVPPR